MKGVVGIVYWEDSGAGSPASRLVRWLRQVWSRVSAGAPRPRPCPRPAEGDAQGADSSGHSWLPDPDVPPLRLVRLEPGAGPVRHLCASGPGLRSRAAGHRRGTAHVVFEGGRWSARHPEGEIEITHCPYCGRRLPGQVPDPNQLRLELAE